MPPRPQRPCRLHGCRTLHRNANGYCDQHQEAAKGWRREGPQQQTTTERGYGWRWQKLRQQVLERDAYLCQPCLQAGRVRVGRDVDHKVNKAQGGSDDLSNLQTICPECHRAKTAAESRTGSVRKSR